MKSTPAVFLVERISKKILYAYLPTPPWELSLLWIAPHLIDTLNIKDFFHLIYFDWNAISNKAFQFESKNMRQLYFFFVFFLSTVYLSIAQERIDIRQKFLNHDLAKTYSPIIGFAYVDSLNIDEKKDSYLASVTDVATNSRSQLFVCDRVDHCIKMYDPQGNFIRTIGTQGKGPGELISPSAITIDSDDKIYVSDSNNRISIFHKDGSFVNILPISGFLVQHIVIAPSKAFLYSTPVSPMRHLSKKERLPAIYQLGLSTNSMKSFGDLAFLGKTRNGYQTVSASFIACSENGEIWYVNDYPYEIKIYEKSGRLKKILHPQSYQLQKPEVFEIAPGTEILIPRTRIKNLLPLQDDKFMLVILDLGKNYLSYYSPKRKPSVEDISVFYDIYSAQGDFLQRFTVPEPTKMGLIIHAHGNNVYTFSPEWPRPTVKKYRIIF